MILAEQNSEEERARKSGKRSLSHFLLGFCESSENGVYRGLAGAGFMEPLLGVLVSGFHQNVGFDCTTTLFSDSH